MKANELRIGNYVNYYFPPFDIFEENHQIESGGDIQVCINYPDAMESIPLTEEWLLKFGFIGKTDSMGDRRYYVDCYQHEIMYIFENGDFYGGYLNDNMVMNSEGVCGIKHVHQLQNLFYALMGEELSLHKQSLNATDKAQE